MVTDAVKSKVPSATREDENALLPTTPTKFGNVTVVEAGSAQVWIQDWRLGAVPQGMRTVAPPKLYPSSRQYDTLGMVQPPELLLQASRHGKTTAFPCKVAGVPPSQLARLPAFPEYAVQLHAPTLHKLGIANSS